VNIPHLRFKEFEEPWKRIKFNQIFQERNKKTGDLSGYPLYSLTVENGITPKTDRYTRDFLVKKEDNYKIVEPNDFAFNPMNMTLGALALNREGKSLAVSGYYNV
jgi:type I restriction enzyme, S subunit